RTRQAVGGPHGHRGELSADFLLSLDGTIDAGGGQRQPARGEGAVEADRGADRLAGDVEFHVATPGPDQQLGGPVQPLDRWVAHVRGGRPVEWGDLAVAPDLEHAVASHFDVQLRMAFPLPEHQPPGVRVEPFDAADNLAGELRWALPGDLPEVI